MSRYKVGKLSNTQSMDIDVNASLLYTSVWRFIRGIYACYKYRNIGPFGYFQIICVQEKPADLDLHCFQKIVYNSIINEFRDPLKSMFYKVNFHLQIEQLKIQLQNTLYFIKTFEEHHFCIVCSSVNQLDCGYNNPSSTLGVWLGDRRITYLSQRQPICPARQNFHRKIVFIFLPVLRMLKQPTH